MLSATLGGDVVLGKEVVVDGGEEMVWVVFDDTGGISTVPMED